MKDRNFCIKSEAGEFDRLFRELKKRGITYNKFDLYKLNVLKDGSRTMFFRSLGLDPDLMIMNALKNIKQMPKVPKRRRKKKDSAIVVEPSLFYDVHMGLLCWVKEVGKSWDVHISSNEIRRIAENIVERYSKKDVAKFLITIGNDFFHLDDNSALTPHSKHILDVDIRYSKIYDAGVLLYRYVIELFAEIADVEVVYVEANHDGTSSWTLANGFKHLYENDGRITVDDTILGPKHFIYGKNLLWLHHGHIVRKNDFNNLIIKTAYDRNINTTKYSKNEVHYGHLHHEQNMQMKTVDKQGFVSYRHFPTIVPKDLYHFKKGFTSNLETMCLEWSLDRLETIKYF